MDPLIILFGLGVGLLVGATGVGGGSIMTPILVLIVGVQPVMAVGTDIAYAAVTKTVGGLRHLRLGTVDLGMTLWLAVGSLPGALVGVVLLQILNRAYGKSFDNIVMMIVSGALIVAGAATLIRAVLSCRRAPRERHTIKLQLRHKLAAVAIGLLVGVLLGLSSTGSGVLIALALILAFRLTPHRVVGTDVAHTALLLWVAAIAHIISGNVDFGLAANILIGSIPGVWIGSGLTKKLPQGVLRPVLGVVLCTAALGMLTKAGVIIPLAVFISVPFVLGLGVWLLLVRLKARSKIAELTPLPDRVEP